MRKGNEINFDIDISKIKIAGSEEEISKTIEELLELNKKIPARSGKEILHVTEIQFDKNKKYTGKKSRGEQKDLYENQLEERREDKEKEIIENRLSETKKEKGGHGEEEYDDIQPIWHEIKRIEKKRGNDTKTLSKKLKKEREN
jgi:hypothetical protein